MSDDEKELPVSKEEVPSEKKGLPIKMIVIAIGAIFLIELIVLLILFLTHSPASESAGATQTEHAADAHKEAGASDTTAHGDTTHTTTEGHTATTAVDGASASGTHAEESTHTTEASTHDAGHATSAATTNTHENAAHSQVVMPSYVQVPVQAEHAESHAANTSVEPEQTTEPTQSPEPSPSPMTELNSKEFPTITIKPNGDIRVGLDDAEKLLKFLSD